MMAAAAAIRMSAPTLDASSTQVLPVATAVGTCQDT